MSGPQKTRMDPLPLLFGRCNAVRSPEECLGRASAGRSELTPGNRSALLSVVCIAGRGMLPPANADSVWVLKRPSDPDPVAR